MHFSTPSIWNSCVNKTHSSVNYIPHVGLYTQCGAALYSRHVSNQGHGSWESNTRGIKKSVRRKWSTSWLEKPVFQRLVGAISGRIDFSLYIYIYICILTYMYSYSGPYDQFSFAISGWRLTKYSVVH